MKRYSLEMCWMRGSVQVSIDVPITPEGYMYTMDPDVARKALDYWQRVETDHSFRVIEWTPKVVEL